MTYHLTWGGAPLCEFLGCMAGVSLARASGVHVCEFESGPEALRALDKLTPHTGAALALLPGPCPTGEAARVLICEPHLKAPASRPTAPPLLDNRNTALIPFEGQRVAYAYGQNGREGRHYVRAAIKGGAWVHEFTSRKEQQSEGWPIQRETRFAFIRRL